MRKYIPKRKQFGQHFLNDPEKALEIVRSLDKRRNYKYILEIGPGKGVLTEHLIDIEDLQLSVAEIDRNLVAELEQQYPSLKGRILEGDFLQQDLRAHFSEPFAIIGNFPYSISSQIIFKMIEHRDMIPEMVGMFQKEVAQRITSGPGSKRYGIISVLVQAWYDTEYLFELGPGSFRPPPKVDSAVIRLRRNKTTKLDCDEKRFTSIVKMAFGQRRKTLRNALKGLIVSEELRAKPIFEKRAEQLGLQEFIELTNIKDIP